MLLVGHGPTAQTVDRPGQRCRCVCWCVHDAAALCVGGSSFWWHGQCRDAAALLSGWAVAAGYCPAWHIHEAVEPGRGHDSCRAVCTRWVSSIRPHRVMVRRHSACDTRSCVVATQIPPRRRSYRTSHPVSNMSGQSTGIPSLYSPHVGARTPGSLLLEAPTGRFVCGSCRLCTTHYACSEVPHHTEAAPYPAHSSPSQGSGYSALAATMWCGCGTSRASALRSGYSRTCNQAVRPWTYAVARYAPPCSLVPVHCAAAQWVMLTLPLPLGSCRSLLSAQSRALSNTRLCSVIHPTQPAH